MAVGVAGPAAVLRSPKDVSAAWLTATLRSAGVLAGTARVIDARVEPLGTGQMADTVRLSVMYEPAQSGPTTLVGKFASEDPISHATGRALRAYEAEVRFYGDVAAGLHAPVPVPLFAAFDPDEAWFTLLLEDIAGADPGDELVGCDADAAAAALTSLANLHAPCWESADLQALEWLNRANRASDDVTAQLVIGVLPGFLERYGDRLAAEHAAMISAFIPRLGEWLGTRPGPRTLVHGDYRLDNLLFPVAPGDPVVVDFQTVIWGPPAYDVAYFVGGCLTQDVRRLHESSLLALYHRQLEAQGVLYPMAQLESDCRRESLGGLMMAVGAAMMVQQTERGDQMFLTSATRHAQHAIDLDALATLPGEFQ